MQELFGLRHGVCVATMNSSSWPRTYSFTRHRAAPLPLYTYQRFLEFSDEGGGGGGNTSVKE